MNKKFYFIFFVISKPLFAMSALGPSKIKHQYYDQRQEHKTVQFVQVPNESEQEYAARLAEALKQGPVNALKEFSTQGAVSGGITVLKKVFPPNPKEIFVENQMRLSLEAEAFQESHEILDIVRNAAQILPKQEITMINAELDEVENYLLSPEYFAHQSEKSFLGQCTELQRLKQSYVSRFNVTLEKFAKTTSLSDKEKYRADLHKKIKELANSLHNIIGQDPIGQGVELSDYKGTIGFLAGAAFILYCNWK